MSNSTVTVVNDGLGNLIVHAANCRDIARERCEIKWDVENASYKALVLDAYDPECFDYDESDWLDFSGDFRIKPCAAHLYNES